MDTRSGPIPGCRVCLLQRPCNCQLGLTICGLTLHPEPEVCSVDIGKITHFILPGNLLEMFDHVDKEFTLASAPGKDHMNLESFKTVKLTVNHPQDKKLMLRN